MTDAAREALAISDKRAMRLTGISMKQLRHWEKVGLVVPSIVRQLSPRNTVRLYNFQDLLELMVAAALRRQPGISLQHIRKLVGYLHKQGFIAPLRELKFATLGSEIYMQFPDGTWSGDVMPEQLVIRQVIELDMIAARIESLTSRDPAAAGKVVTRRGVHQSKPIFAGTRILVSAVQSYLLAGYDTDAIIDEYPALTSADIDAARQLAAAS